jgi:hypothetical protein
MSNLQFKNVTYFTKQFVGKLQTTVNIRISAKKEIAEVISIGSESAIVSYESTNGSASFYGKTHIKFLYDDGMGKVSSNYNADFTADVQSELLTTDSKLLFDVVTVDTQVDTNANTAMLAILLEISVYGYVAKTVKCLVGGENVFARKHNISLLQNVETMQIPFVVDEELTATHPIEGVLLAESGLCISDHYFTDGTLHLKGIATIRLTYTSDGQIFTDSLPFDFEREVDVAPISSNNLQLMVAVRTTKVRLDITQEGNKVFLADITCNLQLESTTVNGLEIVTDCYGTDCDFTLEKQSITTTLPLPTVCGERTFSANLPKEGDKRLQTAVNVSAVVTKCSSCADSIVVDGIVYATAIYAGEHTESEVIEIPFSQKLEAPGMCVGDAVWANVVVTNFDLLDNDELTANVTLCLRANCSRDANYMVITDTERIPFDKTNLPALEIFLAHKGETLWELAKNLHMSTQDIIATNPQLSDPLSEDARIVVFNKI